MIIFSILLIFINGCSASNEEISFVQELGSYSFGPLELEVEETSQFEYSGEEIRILYHVEGWEEGIVSEFAWFVFVDGLPQATRLETK